MSSYYIWYVIYGIFALIPMIGGAAVAAFYRRLSPHISLIITGFGLLALLHLTSSASQIYFMRLMMHRSGAFSTSTYGMMTSMSNLAILVFSLGAWAVLLTGMGLTLRDLQSRLWFNAQSVQNPTLAQTNLNAHYGMPMPQQEIHGVTHVSNFVSAPQNTAPAMPAQSMPQASGNAAPYTAPGVSSEQSDVALRLGSHQS